MSALIEQYDALVCDLDGVVYRGPEAVPHAVDSLNRAQAGGVRIAYATNNASRPPADVAQHLRELGLDAQDDSVINSSMAGASYLADHADAAGTVLAVGGAGVGLALRAQGFDVVSELPTDRRVMAVLQGYGPAVTANDLAQAAYAIQSGALWVATNTDLTLPTAIGTAPGNGSLVGAVRNAVDRDPVVVGKPGPLMYVMAAEHLGSAPHRTLGIGDRLETDVAGAAAAGMDCLHVLTGVHGPSDLVSAPPQLRPRFVAEDLRSLAQQYCEPQRNDGWWMIGDAGCRMSKDGQYALEWHGQPVGVERLRLALPTLWGTIDEGKIGLEQAVTTWMTSH